MYIMIRVEHLTVCIIVALSFTTVGSVGFKIRYFPSCRDRRIEISTSCIKITNGRFWSEINLE